ncbi:hypothetical protein LCGC14_0464610 [marine sediment metagenome]|uniref:Uncharacterized protein n=1 Tax=marine sediment metagenome TaxID=412755 RepID=A0A0F9SJ74_9ZZZZ
MSNSFTKDRSKLYKTICYSIASISFGIGIAVSLSGFEFIWAAIWYFESIAFAFLGVMQ